MVVWCGAGCRLCWLWSASVWCIPWARCAWVFVRGNVEYLVRSCVVCSLFQLQWTSPHPVLSAGTNEALFSESVSGRSSKVLREVHCVISMHTFQKVWWCSSGWERRARQKTRSGRARRGCSMGQVVWKAQDEARPLKVERSNS